MIFVKKSSKNKWYNSKYSFKKGIKKEIKMNKKDNKKAKVHPELEGLEVFIDEFGEIKTNYDIDKINEFLNKHVDDKKLRNRNEDDLEEKEDLDLEKE